MEAFKSHGVDFIVRDKIEDLVAAMNKLAGSDLLKLEHVRTQIEARDREIANPYVKDAQVMNLHNARRYIGDKLIRTASPHRILDPDAGPLIAVKLNILTRKTLGGFETDLDSRVFGSEGSVIPRALCGGRSRRLRRRRRARLSLAGRHLPRRLPVLRPQCRPGRGEGRVARSMRMVDADRAPFLRHSAARSARPHPPIRSTSTAVKRSYTAQLRRSRLVPLVIVLHGKTQTGARHGHADVVAAGRQA